MSVTSTQEMEVRIFSSSLALTYIRETLSTEGTVQVFGRDLQGEIFDKKVYLLFFKKQDAKLISNWT